MIGSNERNKRVGGSRSKPNRIWTALLLLAVALLCGCGPLGPIPGGRLRGDLHSAPSSGWAFTEAIETIQLETSPDDPHSVNAWCGTFQGNLYVPTSLILGADDPEEREWVRNVLADPRIRIRIAGTIYELRAVRVDDATGREGARTALLAKYEVEADAHAEAAWIFRLGPR